MVKTLLSNVEGVGLIPGWGVRSHIPDWLKNQAIGQKQCCNKDFKNGPCQKKNLKKNQCKFNVGYMGTIKYVVIHMYIFNYILLPYTRI